MPTASLQITVSSRMYHSCHYHRAGNASTLPLAESTIACTHRLAVSPCLTEFSRTAASLLRTAAAYKQIDHVNHSTQWDHPLAGVERPRQQQRGKSPNRTVDRNAWS
eukprot:6869-Heterococcus_DN1.PRE.2